jgi:hypothetical protein
LIFLPQTLLSNTPHSRQLSQEAQSTTPVLFDKKQGFFVMQNCQQVGPGKGLQRLVRKLQVTLLNN